MSTATELLRRALGLLERNYVKHPLAHDIRAFLAAEPEAEPKQSGFINIYKSEGGFRGGHVWATEKEADDNREKDWVYCARIGAAEPEAEPVAWQGLTDDEVWKISKQNADDYEYFRAIEAKLKEKNHPPRPEPEAEPVAWGYKNPLGEITDCISDSLHKGVEGKGSFNIPLYTRPEPARKPLPEKIDPILRTVGSMSCTPSYVAGWNNCIDAMSNGVEARKPMTEEEIKELCPFTRQEFVTGFNSGIRFAEKHHFGMGKDDE